MDSRDMTFRIRLSDEILTRVADLALKAHPGECWGLLRGPADSDRVTDVNPLPTERKGSKHFITGDDLMNLALGSDRTHTDHSHIVKALFHSHVGTPPVLSEGDRALMILDGRPAYPVAHLVVQVSADGGSVLAARWFDWEEQRKDYVAAAPLDLPTALPKPTTGEPC
jgi:proteasome lid subunit RPN8/RPN11